MMTENSLKTLTSKNSPATVADAVLETEIAGLQKLRQTTLTDTAFTDAIKLLVSCRGRIVVTGIGKSGHIGRKMSATFSSTGRPSYFLHAAEANHGDLGLITKEDVVIAISNSGESQELFHTLSYCQRFGIPIIGITARQTGTLAQQSTYTLLLPEAEEACPLGLAPTTSTTLTLALGDALAVATMTATGFTADGFHVYHPGGKLGQLLTLARDIMHTGDALPLVTKGTSLMETLLEMSSKRLGCVGVCDTDGSLIGIFTDGDLRRHMSAVSQETPVDCMMSADPLMLNPNEPLSVVARTMSEKRVPSVFLCEDKCPKGILHIHDLLSRGLV
ncbi:KpsF/GutQ family sugar-phosphate isomerase [Ruegeria halocynthiae]|uniref:KpsF/GutQ family sugar-phosphate isomerase n=1 Tax=Ruegeria halocynthiae TaxID=985054 RepID=UPI0006900ADA|nr:KpsF/GutQ family sugar-phosphate isomerase [Ruegeria halocynthiae]